MVDYSRAVEDYPGESLLSLIKVNESGGEMVFVATDANQDLEAPEDYEPLDLKGFFHETEEAMRKKGSSRILFESVDEALEYLSDD